MKRLIKHLTLTLVVMGAFAVPAHAETTLRLATYGLPPTLGNPYRNTGVPNILTWSAFFDGLTRIDRSGNVQPWLATRWEQKDPLTWVFHLRDDVTFSNGRPFTAEAVVNVIDFLTSDEGQRETVAREMSFLAGARALDEHTVEISSSVPAPLMPRSFPILHMVEPEQWRRLGVDGFTREPIGTGPFAVESWESNKVTFIAHKNSWRPPMVDRLEVMWVPDVTARVQGLLSGRVHVATNLGPDDRYAIEAAGGKFMSWIVESVREFSFLLEMKPDSPLQDVRVRRALNYAVDRDAIIAGLLDGATVPANQGASRAAYGYDKSLPPIPYDPDRARALLAEAGYGNGFTFVLETTTGASANDAATYQRVAEDLARIGVTMEIRPWAVPEMLRSIDTGEFDGDAFFMVFTMEPTIDVMRPMRVHSCLWRHPWYCDRRIMPTIEAAFTEPDPVRRIELRHEVLRFYRDQMPALFLWEDVRFGAMAPGVSGFEEVHGFISYDRLAFD